MEVLRMIISILVPITLAVIGLFLGHKLRMRDKKEDKLVAVTDRLIESQHNLDKTVVKLSENILSQVEICKLKHTPIRDRLDKHSKELDSHTRQLHKIENRLTRVNGM